MSFGKSYASERLGLREMQRIRVVTKASGAKDFLPTF